MTWQKETPQLAGKRGNQIYALGKGQHQYNTPAAFSKSRKTPNSKSAMPIGRYIDALLVDASVVEVRHLPTARSGKFDDAEKLIDALGPLMNSGNLYTTLNRPECQDATNSFGTSAFRDADINRIVRIPFDFDPVRASGTASSDEELAFAKDRCDGLLRMLHADGWPIPLQAMSGNGYHLQYRTALPVNAETKEMLSLIYRGLSEQFSDDEVDFDTTVRNPSRILRLYGTANRKGKNPDLWRRASCEIPRQWRQVRPQQVERLAERFARKPIPAAAAPRASSHFSGKGDYSTLDIVGWFKSLGLYEHPIEGNKHAVTCPWENEHSQQNPNDTIIYAAEEGWPGFYCHHSHCDGRGIHDVMTMLGDADSFCAQSWRKSA